MRHFLIFAAVCALLFARAASASDGPVTAETAHYHLVATGTQAEADDWAKLLEAAWPLYTEFFGKAPVLGMGEHLNVAFFEDSPSMLDAIRKAGGSPPEGEGGYYDPVSKAAYLFRQPSAWYTRALLLHECGHQFHRRAKGYAGPLPFWYGEGIVEHLSRHTWDGEHLRMAVVPMLTLENYAAKALTSLASGAFDLDAVLDGKAECPRPEAMHLVRYLCSGEGGKLRAKFDDAAAKLDRGGKFDASSFTHAFGPAKKFTAAWRAWTETVQEPWEVLTVDWDARAADALRGFSPSVVALCRRRAETKRVSARVRPLGTGAWKAGVLLRYGGPDDYDIGMIENGTRVHIDRRSNGTWQRLADAEAPKGTDGAWRVEAVRDGGSVSFVVEGTSVATIEAPPGSMGLAVDSTTADFTDIKAQ